MSNFNFTEENKKELFENGCTFFDALGTDIISNLNHWDKEIRSLDISKSECYQICPMDADFEVPKYGHQHWHTFDLQGEFKKNDRKNYRQYCEYITEINDFFYDIPTKREHPVSPTNIQISHYNDCNYPHRDGYEVENHASLLVYLNKNWKSEYGGELTVIDPQNGKKYVHLPEFGSVALIDFSKHNPVHEVRKVKSLSAQRLVMFTPLNTGEFYKRKKLSQESHGLV